MGTNKQVPTTKVCILFRPDDEAARIIELMVGELLGLSAPVSKRTGELPYHMTIIGGGGVEETSAGETLKGVIRQIKPFSEGTIPQVIDVEPAQLFGDCLAIRLKLKGYVITGDRKKNKELRTELRSRFHFDGPRHITLFTIAGANKYQDMDGNLEKLELLLFLYREKLLQMRLYPEVWVMPHGSNIWRRWVHD